MWKNVNKLHFQCTNFNTSTRVYAECIYVFLSKSDPRRWMPCWLLTNVRCDEFPVPQIDRKSKQVKEHSAMAARGCLPPGANDCVATPANQISSAIRVFFRISDIGVWTNFWGPFLYPSFLFSPLPSPLFPFHPPIIPQRGLGRSPSRNWSCCI